MICKVLITSEEGQVLAGTFSVSKGKLKFEANEGYDGMMEDLKDFVCFEGEEEVKSTDAKRWVELLPKNLFGSYLRAEGVQE